MNRSPSMALPARLARFWHTARHLRPRQAWHQARRRLAPPRLTRTAAPIRGWVQLDLQPGAGREMSLLGPGRFRFLNHTVDLGQPIDWNAPGEAHLWQYHLHYFDCLGQPGLDARTGLDLLRDWMARHPVARPAVGWEPYPLSLRIVNWLQFLQAGPAAAGGVAAPAPEIVGSLALQGTNLARQMEHHLLGNHLFANAKALWWLGACLGHEAWLRTGRELVLRELAEQFLPDGGHFELSPMYHALLTEDLLDLVNLARATRDAEAAERLSATAIRALAWLTALAGPRLTLPLFNDAVHEQARPLPALLDYAQRLGLQPAPATGTAAAGAALDVPTHGWSAQCSSGYWVLTQPDLDCRVLFDTALLGPDYLPGHAHADLLSLLLEVRGREVFTDTGVPEYAEGPARAYCRSTAAHNTVRIDDLDQAELWKSFRVGRRGHPSAARWTEEGLRCSHDGFHVQSPGVGHARTICPTPDGFTVIDDLSGPGRRRFESRFHLAPGLIAQPVATELPMNRSSVDLVAHETWEIRTGSSDGTALRLRLELEGATGRIITTPYHPAFGRTIQRSCLVLDGEFTDATRVTVRVVVSVPANSTPASADDDRETRGHSTPLEERQPCTYSF